VTSSDLYERTDIDEGVRALKADLLGPDGPRISTTRKYNFAILPYHPSNELKLRARIKTLSEELRAEGWSVLSIALHRLLLDRLRRLEPDHLASVIAREKRLYCKDPERALTHLTEFLSRHIEGPDGLATDVAKTIADFKSQLPSPDAPAVAFIGRAGALYPFFRTSALLRHIDGHTGDVPVILLYPGERRGLSALSFMGELTPDRDYRPRIYP
jgi:hypothetical protein